MKTNKKKRKKEENKDWKQKKINVTTILVLK